MLATMGYIVPEYFRFPGRDIRYTLTMLTYILT